MPESVTRQSSKLPVAFYGAVKDPSDRRDFRYSPAATTKKLPASVDLRPFCPRIHEQGHPLTCTAQALAGAFQFEQRRLGLKDFSPSRLFIFYNTLASMHVRNIAGKDGANLRAALKAVARHGVCPEKNWPFSLTRAAMARKPNRHAYELAEHHKVTRYERIVLGKRSRSEFLRLMNPPGGRISFCLFLPRPRKLRRAHVAKRASCPCPSVVSGCEDGTP